MHGHRKKTLFFLERLHGLARELATPPSELCVLDVGCGNGSLVSLPVAEAGFDLLGLDIHEPSILWAREHNRLPNAEFRVAAIDDVGAEERFDVVILSDVLEHVQDPEGLLARARQLVGERGIVLVSIPNGFGPFELEQGFARTWIGGLLVRALRRSFESAARLRRRLRGIPWNVEDQPKAAYNLESGHVQHFTLRRFRRLVSSTGLGIAAQANGALMGGDLSYFAFYAVPRMVDLSLRAANHLPAQLVSTWYFELRAVG